LEAPELEAYFEPESVSEGESAELVWVAINTDRVIIDHNIGTVIPKGRMRVFPEETATYLLRAEGPGGAVDKSITIEVATPASAEDLATAGLPLAELFRSSVKPVFFDFDSAELSEESKITLNGNIRWLQHTDHGDLRFLIRGHCDDRGTEEYNLALGDKRARIVRQYLIQNGISPSRMRTVSLGEELPFAEGDEDEAHALNRRAHFVLMQ
jgi:peptidoglycan-associated lipoprotein